MWQAQGLWVMVAWPGKAGCVKLTWTLSFSLVCRLREAPPQVASLFWDAPAATAGGTGAASSGPSREWGKQENVPLLSSWWQKNHHKLGSLKWHRFVILQFWRSEDQSGSHWATVEVPTAIFLQEAPGQIHSLDLFHFSMLLNPFALAPPPSSNLSDFDSCSLFPL